LALPRLPCYYRPLGEIAENLALMRQIDKQYLRTPYCGSRELSA
jgi:putative transposase